MHLTLDLVPAFAALYHPDDHVARRSLAERTRKRLTTDPIWSRRRLIALDADGQPAGATFIDPVSDDAWVMGSIRGVAPVGEWAATLISDAIGHARSGGARTIGTRVPRPRLAAPYQAALEAAGFRQDGARVEYKTPLSALDGDDGTPLSWRGADAARLSGAAELLRRCSLGDPDGLEADDDPASILRGYLSADDLTTDLGECVHLGALDGEPVAFVCAQVAPADGWSRITYMGLVPEARGRGLGHWVHRHGLAMLKAQGGALYHGGTRVDNHPMRACFARQGCVRWAELVEWSWRAERLA